MLEAACKSINFGNKLSRSKTSRKRYSMICKVTSKVKLESGKWYQRKSLNGKGFKCEPLLYLDCEGISAGFYRKDGNDLKLVMAFENASDDSCSYQKNQEQSAPAQNPKDDFIYKLMRQCTETISYNNWNALVSQLCFEAYNRMVSIYNHATKNIDDREFYLKWCEPFRGHEGNKISWAKKILGDTEASCDLFELSRTLYKMSREKGFADTPASLLRELFLQFTCTYCQYGFERSAFSRQRRSV